MISKQLCFLGGDEPKENKNAIIPKWPMRTNKLLYPQFIFVCRYLILPICFTKYKY